MNAFVNKNNIATELRYIMKYLNIKEEWVSLDNECSYFSTIFITYSGIEGWIKK